MKAVLQLSTLLLLALTVSSCSVMAIKSHNPNFKNTREIEKKKGTFKIAAVKGKDAAISKILTHKEMTCRLTTFNMPVDSTVGAYVTEAFSNELDAAKKLDTAGTPIEATINVMTSDTSGMNVAVWHMDIDYLVNKKTINVKTATEFTSAFSAQAACSNTANAFGDALAQNFVEMFKKL